MRLSMFSLFLSSTLFLTACAHNVPVTATVVDDIVLTRTDKIAGQYLLKISPDNMTSEAQFSGMACAFESYPIDIRESFKNSLFNTMKNVFSDIELDNGTNSSNRTLISINLKPIDARFHIVENGIFSAAAHSNIKLKAVIVVTDTTGKRLYGQSFDGTSASEANAGFCAGVPNSIKKGMEDATRDLVQKITENVGNAL